MVAAEDTRRLRTLAKALDVHIAGRVVSFFDQNEPARVTALVAEIIAGATVLLVSDAGMPVISDPGHRLVTACVDAGVPVTCLPGPSAVIAALAVSGLPSDKFCFEGFAPRKQSARRSWLASLAEERRTCVFFESPRRLANCLHDAVDQLGGRVGRRCAGNSPRFTRKSCADRWRSWPSGPTTVCWGDHRRASRGGAAG